MKIKIKNILLIALLIPIFIAIILFQVKFVAKFEYKEFMSTLENKVYERNETNPNDIIEPFEDIFGKYYDNAGLWIAFYIITSYSVLIVTIVELIILVIIQLQKNCCACCCKKCCSIYFIIHSLLNMIIYLAFAFDEKSEINLEKDKIYSFDEEFNKEIKKNLDFMKSRKIFLVVCVFVAILGIIGELVIVILNMLDDYYNNNNYTTAQPKIVYNVENFKQVNNLDSNETDKHDN